MLSAIDYEFFEGPEEWCYFCGKTFADAAGLEAHILHHFNRKHCDGCANDLISIAGKWYQLHIDINCAAVKTEPDFNCTEIEIRPDPLDIAEHIIKSEPIDITEIFTAVELVAPLDENVPKENPTEQNRFEAPIKRLSCPFCPARFNFPSNRSVHKKRFHSQEVAELKLRQSTVKNREQRRILDTDKPDATPNENTSNENQIEQSQSEAPIRPFPCSFCPLRFFSAGNRNRHTNHIHKQEAAQLKRRQSAEDYKEKRRISYSTIDTHKPDTPSTATVPNERNELLSPIKPYACLFCPIRFNFTSNRSAHTNRFHKQQVAELKLRQRAEREGGKRKISNSTPDNHDEAVDVSLLKNDDIKRKRSNEELQLDGSLPSVLKKRLRADEPSTNSRDKSEDMGDHDQQHSAACEETVSLEMVSSEAVITCAPNAITHDLEVTSAALENEDNSSDAPQATEAPHEKPYKCKFCSAAFNGQAGRYNHMYRHHSKEVKKLNLFRPVRASASSAGATSSKPFKCKFCSVSYSHDSTLYNHTLRNHKKEMNELRLRKIVGNGDIDLESNECDGNAESEVEEILEKYDTRGKRSQTTYNVDKWTCGFCSKSFNWEQNAHKHLRLMHGSSDASMVTLMKHKQSTELWYCGICYFTTKHKISIHSHTWHVHHTKDRRLSKPIQDWQDPDQLQLAAGDEEKCDYCPMEFNQTSELHQHKRAEHIKQLDDAGVMKCSRCPALFDSNILDKIHSIQVHGVLDQRYLNKLECIVCGESFVLSNRLVSHLEVHGARESYMCSRISCSEQFNTIEQLGSHLKKHPILEDDAGKRKCQKCQKQYDELNFSTHHCFVDGHCCDQCGKRFTKLCLLQAHLDVHNGTKRFKCEYCPAKFTTSANQIKHQRTHTGDKRCKCTVPDCNKAFIQHTDLYRHQYKAHGIYRKKFPCTICEKVFPENSLLRKHLASHDSNG